MVEIVHDSLLAYPAGRPTHCPPCSVVHGPLTTVNAGGGGGVTVPVEAQISQPSPATEPSDTQLIVELADSEIPSGHSVPS